MNCKEVQELLDCYQDLPEHSVEKQQVEEHRYECSVCHEQFDAWEKSSNLLKTIGDEDIELTHHVSKRVMDRIYQQESWRIPVPNRVYNFSYPVKRNLMAVISFFVVIFMTSFVYSLIQKGRSMVETTHKSIIGLQPIASASGNYAKTAASTVPNGVASLSDLPMFHMGPIHTFPDYLIALSFLGLTSTLLVMNWLSRTQS
jgi:predicted anti-sigma-YlaC factor YlaD